MNAADRDATIERLLADCADIMAGKSQSYAGREDTLANFKRNAERIGLTPCQIWATYFNKHVDSINNAIMRNPAAPSDCDGEPMRGRVTDAINYLCILECILKETECQQNS